MRIPVFTAVLLLMVDVSWILCVVVCVCVCVCVCECVCCVCECACVVDTCVGVCVFVSEGVWTLLACCVGCLRIFFCVCMSVVLTHVRVFGRYDRVHKCVWVYVDALVCACLPHIRVHKCTFVNEKCWPQVPTGLTMCLSLVERRMRKHSNGRGW